MTGNRTTRTQAVKERMKMVALVWLAIFYLSPSAVAQWKKIPVFESGQNGYESYRIPAIIALPNGDLLAFAEGRVNGAADFGNVDIVMKSSVDNGKTWSKMKVIVDNDTLQAGNPAPVVDFTDPRYPKGRIFLFYNTGNRPEGEIRKGRGVRRVAYVTSSDNGRSWSAPIDITRQVKKPNWRSYANTPGHALQFRQGKYKGRIYVAANHSQGEPLPHFKDYHAHGYYSDDHGKTFHLSESIQLPGSNEATAAALGGNILMMNIRNQMGTPRCRIVAISRDGGRKWDTAYYDPHLPDPVCQGTLLHIGRKKQPDLIAFCNNADTAHRRNLTLRISWDGGKSWERQYRVDAKDRSTAYADIVKVSARKIGVLYERDDYAQIALAVIPWKK